MKRVLALLVLVFASGCFRRHVVVVSDDPVPVVLPPPAVVVTVDTFGPHLDPYGTWIVLPGHGRAWQPAVQYVGGDFYPYGSGGHWVYTNAGWVFDSDYPFGWAVFHYGRWYLDDDRGWLWIPGDRWAPAWVSWRMGGAYVGWAPLGPLGEPVFHRRHWLFVETGSLTRPHVHQHAIGEQQFHAAVTITQPVHGAVPVGPPPSYVSAATRGRIVPVPVTDVRTSGRVVPPPPPPGRVTAAVPPPPPPATTPGPPPPAGRLEPERMPPPPAPGRLEPERQPPPPAPGRLEPERQPPPPAPGRLEPERLPPPPAPGRVEPERQPPPPAPGRLEPERRPAPQREELRAPPPARLPPPPPPAGFQPERQRAPQPGLNRAPPPPTSAAPGQPPPPARKKTFQPSAPPPPARGLRPGPVAPPPPPPP